MEKISKDCFQFIFAKVDRAPIYRRVCKAWNRWLDDPNFVKRWEFPRITKNTFIPRKWIRICQTARWGHLERSHHCGILLKYDGQFMCQIGKYSSSSGDLKTYEMQEIQKGNVIQKHVFWHWDSEYFSFFAIRRKIYNKQLLFIYCGGSEMQLIQEKGWIRRLLKKHSALYNSSLPVYIFAHTKNGKMQCHCIQKNGKLAPPPVRCNLKWKDVKKQIPKKEKLTKLLDRLINRRRETQ